MDTKGETQKVDTEIMNSETDFAKDENTVHEKFTGQYSDYYDRFALSFLKARTSMALSSVAMAEKLGIDKTRYSRLENKKIPATVDFIIALIEETGMSPNEIFAYDDGSSVPAEQAHEMLTVLTALPRDSFDFISNVILHEVKSLKKPKVKASKKLTVPEVFEILDSIRPKE